MPPTATAPTVPASPSTQPGEQAAAERSRSGRPGVPQDAIFAAVLTLLSEVGYEAMTVDGIAQRAHVSKATVYKRWDGKPRLVVAALKCQSSRTPIDPDTGTLRADLLAFARDLNTAEDRTGGLVVAVAHAVQRDRELAAVVESELGAPIRNVLITIVGRAVARGELAAAPAAPDLAYDVLPLMVIAPWMFTGRRHADSDLEHLVDAIVLPCLRAVPAVDAATSGDDVPQAQQHDDRHDNRHDNRHETDHQPRHGQGPR